LKASIIVNKIVFKFTKLTTGPTGPTVQALAIKERPIVFKILPKVPIIKFSLLKVDSDNLGIRIIERIIPTKVKAPNESLAESKLRLVVKYLV